MSISDPEIDAMARLEAALRPLDADAAGRVLRWAAERYGPVCGAPVGTTSPAAASEPPGDIAELFSPATLGSDADRALLAAYWFQHVRTAKSFTGQQLNSELKQMGIGIANITHALSRLIERRPALVQQLSKSGRSQQARKQYRLTSAGLEAAASLLRPGSEGEPA